MGYGRDRRTWAGWIVIMLAALLYLMTLDTGLRPDELSGGDLITHQYAQVQARPSNAPGYPLYTMGGWLWFRLTRPLFGWVLSPIQRLSSYSTLWALLALLVLYRLILRITHGNWLVAALATAFYSVTYFFWYYSVTTEQYTSAVFQTLLIVWLAFKWDEATAQGNQADRYLLWLALVAGTCLANLVTTLFVLPPLIYFILSRRPELLHRPRLILGSLGLTFLPLISYVYVYARGAAHPEWRGAGEWPNALAWFLDFVTTQQGRDELAPGLSLTRFFTAEYPTLIWGELTWVVLIGGGLGLAWLGRRRALFLYGTLAIYLLFGWVDRFGNWYQVIIPAYPLVVLGFAAGLNVLWTRAWQFDAWKLGIRTLIVLGCAALVAYRLAVSLPRADQSHRPEDTGLNPGWAVLADQPLAGSMIVSEHSEWLALQYLVDIWGAQPLIYPRPVCQPGSSLPGTNPRTLSTVTAVYLTRRAVEADPTCLADQHRYAAGANLIRVQATPNTQLPDLAWPAALQFGTEMKLAGFEVHLDDLGRWRLSLYWLANTAIDTDYTISVRPLRNGQLLAGPHSQPLIQDHQPVWNSYPTSRWSPGEIVRDDYVLDLPQSVVPDSAHILVYRNTAAGFEILAEADLSLSP